VFGVAVASPAGTVSLQKIQGQLHDAGALETIAHYLHLLEEAYLVAVLPKHAARAACRQAAPPKLITLNQALLAVTAVGGSPSNETAPRGRAWRRPTGVISCGKARQRARGERGEDALPYLLLGAGLALAAGLAWRRRR
jgi:hypothetical protein